ncbi:MAG: IclR family transcriptional regulator [Clostridiales bacterium]|nr:IclR family transcriptional regulator [Clostridiales bacterium]
MSKEIKLIQSVQRAFDILYCFDSKKELGVTEISILTNLHKSTTYNLVVTLEHLGLLQKNNGKYRLGIELFRLGTMVNSNIRHICIPYLEKLIELFSETVNLVARRDSFVIYLEKIESPHSMRIGTNEGKLLPLHCTATGKAILSTLTSVELEDFLADVTFENFTEHTILTAKDLKSQINEIVLNGYAEDIEEYELGLICVSAPIRDHTGKSNFAISVSGPSSRMTEEIREKIGQTLVDFTSEISKKLGY